MKKMVFLVVFAFVAFVLEGCAPYYATYYTEPEPEPAPQPKPRETPKPRKTVPVTKKAPETEIVTDNLYPIPKTLDVDNDLTIASMTPVAYTTQDHCNEVYFFSAIVTPASGYHGLVDISMSETKIEGGYSCKYFGTAVVYKVKPNPIVKETVKYEDVVRKYVTE